MWKYLDQTEPTYVKTEWCQSRLSVGRFCPEEGGLSQCIAVNINSWWIISDYSEWIDYADNRGGMKTKNPDHHPGNARIRGRRFLTFHAANVQIWATGHFLSRLGKHNRNNNNQLGFYKERLDMLVWLNNWANLFLPRPIVIPLLDFSKTRKVRQKLELVLGWLYIFSLLSVTASLLPLLPCCW